MSRHKLVFSALVFCVGLTGFLSAGDSGVNSKISGFIKFDDYFDNRQVVSAREGHFLLYPKAVDRNAQGDDVNDVFTTNMVSFQTRLRLNIAAPDVQSAKVTGLIECDFFGTSNGNENELRLRHAFIKMDFGSHQHQFGQYWSPLFTTAVYPQVVSFNTGVPFQPFARNPQVRSTMQIGKALTIYIASTMQRDAYQEIGGRVKQQMSGIPGLHAHAELGNANTLIGGGGHIRTIRPADSADVFTSTVLTAYGKIIGPKLAVRGKVIYGGDMADQLMLGGYAAITDATNGVTEYKPLNNLSAWLDVMTTGKTISMGIFAGYSTNLGLSSDISGTDIYSLASSRSPNIADLWRVSPRFIRNAGKLRFAVEIEITSALYTSGYESNLAPKELASDERVTNIRGLFATYLFF
ncbi:MAG: hypothetical protein H8E14_03390 [Candidatus Marinimicrobia bacterium]|nr:hypothetical protein [Candidatus Neomarinimicrobiota bacterium]